MPGPGAKDAREETEMASWDGDDVAPTTGKEGLAMVAPSLGDALTTAAHKPREVRVSDCEGTLVVESLATYK